MDDTLALVVLPSQKVFLSLIARDDGSMDGAERLLHHVQRLVGGLARAICSHPDDRPSDIGEWTGYLNEQADLRGLPFNPIATAMARLAGWGGGSELLGNVVFLGPAHGDVPPLMVDLARSLGAPVIRQRNLIDAMPEPVTT